MQTGGQPYASWEVPPRVSEEKHGPHNHMLPQRGMPGPRPHRSGHYGYPGRKERRCLCTQCRKTCSATTGTAFSRLRTTAETVVLCAGRPQSTTGVP